MSFKKCLLLLLCLILISGCKTRKPEKESTNLSDPSKTVLSGSFVVSGAYALTPLARQWADDFMKIHPDVNIEVRETGTGQGISDLLEKKAMLAMISRPLAEPEKEAGIWTIPVAKDGVATIVNQDNPFINRIMKQGLSTDELQKLFTSDFPVRWGEVLDTAGTQKAVVYARVDESGAAEVFAGFFYKKASDLKGVKVNGDLEMIKSIQDNKLAIGFCNFSYAFDFSTGERKEKIQLVPFDLDFDNKVDRKEWPFKNLAMAHRSIWLGIYPECLCRELMIGSVGKPTNPAIIEFLKYVLSAGQEKVKEKGLCELNNVYIRYALESLQ
jgi:phosphate transport system substrate-binding protein